jgi:hypothetical protein
MTFRETDAETDMERLQNIGAMEFKAVKALIDDDGKYSRFLRTVGSNRPLQMYSSGMLLGECCLCCGRDTSYVFFGCVLRSQGAKRQAHAPGIR